MGEMTSIVAVALLAVAAPIVAKLIDRWAAVPVVVLEILLGIALGPSGLGVIGPSAFLALIADFGLAMLFFVAGTEVDFRAIAGRPLRRASLAWLISFAAAFGVGFLHGRGFDAAVVIGVALSSTALGAVLPILRDGGMLRTPFGGAATAVGAVGEFGPLVAISVFLGARDIGWSTLVLGGFVLVTGALIWLSIRMDHAIVHRLVAATIDTTGQFAVRLVIAITTLLVALSMLLGLDMLLGAFAAGVLWRIIIAGAPHRDRERVESKIDAVAFGFLVPVFFIATGVDFDLASLVAEPWLFALVPLLLVALLIVRGVPAQLAAPPGASRRDRIRLGLYAATGLPIIVAVTSIGVSEGLLGAGIASALVAAGMLSVLVFPLLASIGREAPSVGGEFEASVEPPREP